MNAKTKLIFSIVAMCLVITLGVLGILAVKTLNMTVGGNISFSADGLSLEVSAGVFKTTDDGDYSNITTQTNKLQAFAIDTDTKLDSIQDKIDSWSNLDLYLDGKGDAVLHFSVTNNMTTPLFVYITTTLGTNINDNMDLIVSQTGVPVNAGQTTEFTITFDIIDMNINAGFAGFNIAVEFDRGEKLLVAQNKIDQATGMPTTEVDYYYIEMGTYNGQPVRWRYVADVNGQRYTDLSAPKTLKGYYVLETVTDIRQSFLAKEKYDDNFRHITQGYTNIRANDYGISDVRAFLTNAGSGGYMEALGISENDKIYSQITARTVSDLYSKIQRDGTAIDSTYAQNYSLSLTGEQDISNQSDKFWLMSYSEAETFFADKQARLWGGGKYYSLRTPNLPHPSSMYFVYAEGVIDVDYIYKDFAIRPAFKIG